ncbi:MAG: hypothetical protein JSU65_13825 [Candidatus Zixiibacteriota bacterium]|nr:MAG: hypothetical protein JSU65_13825 [candidate division Zixibacteria bacterium]
MRKTVYLLAGVIALYLLLSLLMAALYGPSYGFLQGEDSWVPDGSGGWAKHGSPDGPPPDEASVNVPIMIRYVPILIPGLLLVLFLFTPLRRLIETPPPEEKAEDSETESGESPTPQ